VCDIKVAVALAPPKTARFRAYHLRRTLRRDCNEPWQGRKRTAGPPRAVTVSPRSGASRPLVAFPAPARWATLLRPTGMVLCAIVSNSCVPHPTPCVTRCFEISPIRSRQKRGSSLYNCDQNFGWHFSARRRGHLRGFSPRHAGRIPVGTRHVPLCLQCAIAFAACSGTAGSRAIGTYSSKRRNRSLKGKVRHS